jgi:hypothetical protein
MDPFLEDPAFFGGVHDNLIAYLREHLQPRLPEPYYAETADRAWVEVVNRYIEPDVNVLRAGGGAPTPGSAAPGAAVAEAVEGRRVLVHAPMVRVSQERREPYLEILTRLGDREHLVCSIEVLSPSNKMPGEQSRDLYLRKQGELLRSQVHLVEVDLLRGGQHSTAVPRERALAEAGSFDYHVCVHQFDKHDDFVVYPVLLADRLPVIVIPLLPGDGSVAVDVQEVFQRCYDTGPYRRRVDYAEATPVPPLTAEQAAWVQQLLREKGLRKA